MSSFIGSSGKIYNLISDPVKSGGEGEIFEVSGAPSLIAKIYKPEKQTSFQRKKIQVLADQQVPPAISNMVAWPIETLSDKGQIVGFIMPRVKTGKELCVVNGEDFEYQGKKLTFQHKVAIAHNVSLVISNIHSMGNIVGDMNPRNIFVDMSSLQIVMIDTDSYNVVDKKSGNIYRCSVGHPEYIAPELFRKMETENADLASVSLPSYTQETDNFALAIHIFSLLMNGYHPFACRIIKKTQASVPFPRKPDNIKRGFSPFFEKNDILGTPLGAPDLNVLPYDIRIMFKRAFVDGFNDPNVRPSAQEWERALHTFYFSLIQCNKNPDHYYSKNFTKCPWCIINKKDVSNIVVNTADEEPTTYTQSQKQIIYSSPPTYTPSPNPSNTPDRSKLIIAATAVIAIAILIVIYLITK